MPDSDDDKAHPPLVDDDDGVEDVTDVWDEEKLKAALGSLHKDEELGPATASKREAEASIQVAEDLGTRDPSPSQNTPTPTPPAPAGGGGLSWPQTIGLAIGLAVAVYLLITFLK